MNNLLTSAPTSAPPLPIMRLPTRPLSRDTISSRQPSTALIKLTTSAPGKYTNACNGLPHMMCLCFSVNRQRKTSKKGSSSMLIDTIRLAEVPHETNWRYAVVNLGLVKAACRKLGQDRGLHTLFISGFSYKVLFHKCYSQHRHWTTRPYSWYNKENQKM